MDLFSSEKDFFEILPPKAELLEGRIILEKIDGKILDVKKIDRQELKDMGWPINTGTYTIRDPASPVVVICPTQDSELQEKAITFGAAASGPCVTPDRGIEIIITNIVANPNIRFIILIGKDSGHLSGDALYSLVKYGIDHETRRIKNTKSPTNPYLMNIPLEIIERFRKQVQVINLLGSRKAELVAILVKCMIQEPENPVKYTDTKLGDSFILCDRGTEDREPLKYILGVTRRGGYFEGFSRTGTTLHTTTVAESYPLIESHILANGSFGMQESSRSALDVTGLQIVFSDIFNELIPEDWKPHGWMRTKEQAEEYVKRYARWVYLFPLSDVRLLNNNLEPYIPEKMDYAYGTRLTAYNYESADDKEREALVDLIKRMHIKFRTSMPSFKDVVAFYKEMEFIQSKSFNQLYTMAKAAKISIENNFTNSYRLYMTLQIPNIDSKPDPREAHAPCFALFTIFPRKIAGKWQLDANFYIQRNDFLAYPANVNGAIMLQKFLSWYTGIKPGTLLYHAGCIHICDYMLPKDILDRYKL